MTGDSINDSIFQRRVFTHLQETNINSDWNNLREFKNRNVVNSIFRVKQARQLCLVQFMVATASTTEECCFVTLMFGVNLYVIIVTSNFIIVEFFSDARQCTHPVQPEQAPRRIPNMSQVKSNPVVSSELATKSVHSQQLYSAYTYLCFSDLFGGTSDKP